MGDIHRPVLVREVLDSFRAAAGERVFVDATVGLGGHAHAILERFPQASVVGIDIDSEAISLCRRRLARYGDRAMTIRGSYQDLGSLLCGAGVRVADAILIDTGLSSYDIGTPGRGFSFSLDGPLDMRYSRTSQTRTARDVVNREHTASLRRILQDYGEVPFAGRVASAIAQARSVSPIETTGELVEIVKRSLGRRIGYGKLEGFLAKVFQAIRISVNQELDVLEAGLRQSIGLLASGGRLLVICYESLSHRLTKRVFREFERGCVCPSESPVCICGRKPEVRILTKRAITPSALEVAENSRSRSAGLRVLQRLHR
ncbi:MAG: 16S rRNA (cytosine(1402)-N(4))-methyltransferase RsmH [Candidatus Coatesbacteria bacterium]|nr:16S rRNA (cytosine(1402)-N(4))-methyltransferase RsmH [Candidatus Coatesbacteria bacterium]